MKEAKWNEDQETDCDGQSSSTSSFSYLIISIIRFYEVLSWSCNVKL